MNIKNMMSNKQMVVRFILIVSIVLTTIFTIGNFLFDTVVIIKNVEPEELKLIIAALAGGFVGVLCLIIIIILTLVSIIKFIKAVYRLIKPNKMYDCCDSIFSIAVINIVANLLRLFIVVLIKGRLKDTSYSYVGIGVIHSDQSKHIQFTISPFIGIVIMVGICVGMKFLKEYIVNRRVEVYQS